MLWRFWLRKEWIVKGRWSSGREWSVASCFRQSTLTRTMTDNPELPLVVKVGGSLFDLPDLGPRLQGWLDQCGDRPVLLVPGGGAVVDAVRQLDRCHELGDERAHWLALRGLRLNAYFLASLLPGTPVIEMPEETVTQKSAGSRGILDPFSFALADEGRPGALPHSWSVTSDSIAARAALAIRPSELVLLKSVECAESSSWEEAARHGWVDRFFPGAVCGISRIRVINFRHRARSGS
jgi:5-(aminomethyl)-3-furanmethanol phosphate kinase